MMRKLGKNVYRYWSVYLAFLKNSAMAQMEYRSNFYLGIFVESGWVASKLAYVYVIYHTNLRFFDLPKEAFLLFSGTFMLVTGIYVSCFVGNFFRISDYVRDGTLDLFLTKPISLQFMTTLRYVDFGLGLPNMIVGVFLVITGWQQVGLEFNLLRLAGYLALLVNSIVLSYSVMLLPNIFSFWVVNTSAVNDLSNEIWEFSHIPMSIYNRVVQFVGIYIFPIFVIGNYAPLFLFSQLEIHRMIWAFLASVVAFSVTRMLWRRGVRNYSSASS